MDNQQDGFSLKTAPVKAEAVFFANTNTIQIKYFMYTTYQINADDLNLDFIEILKKSFRHKKIEITVREANDTLELEQRRNLLAIEVQDAIAEFRQGNLSPQNSDAIITELRATLT